jgi:hypothetical protein
MDSQGHVVATPTDNGDNKASEGILDGFEPGYAQRAKHMLPRQGKAGPWRLEMNYAKDKKILLNHPVADEFMKFESRNNASVESSIKNKAA